MRLEKRPGQALVEFALACPLLLAFMIGIADLGWLYHHQLIMTNAAREGARYGALNATDAEVRSRVTDYMQSAGFAAASPAVTIDQSGGMSRVTVDATMPMLFAWSGPSLTLTASSSMRRE